MKLAHTFPDAKIVGLDLSPFMLAVAQFQLQNKDDDLKNKFNIQYMHGCGEKTGLGKNDVDLVSMCLVNHELPAGFIHIFTGVTPYH